MDLPSTKQALREFICTELLRKPNYALRDDQPLITGGLIDSFSLVQVGVFIEEEFGVYVPDTDLTVAKMDTLNQMAARVLAG
jgi:acyl carrier protein